MAEVLYFASLREKLGSSREQLPLPDAITVAQLKSLLAGRGGAWSEIFTDSKAVLVAINQQMANDDSPIQGADEVAFFPPVTGG